MKALTYLSNLVIPFLMFYVIGYGLLAKRDVYRDFLDKSSLISEMTVPEAKEFLASGNAGGGMLPKLQSCIDAIESGVSRVHILDGRIEHSLLLEFFTNKGIGTAIIGDEEERYYAAK